MKLYIDITTSKYFALSTYVLFISVMQLIRGAQSLNNVCLFILSICLPASVASAPTTVMFPLTSIYASLQSYKPEFSIEFLNLIWLLMLHIPRES